MAFEPLRPEDGKPFGAARIIELQERLAAYVDERVAERATVVDLNLVRRRAAGNRATTEALAELRALLDALSEALEQKATHTELEGAVAGLAPAGPIQEALGARVTKAALAEERSERVSADRALLDAILAPPAVGDVTGLSAAQIDALPAFRIPPKNGVVATGRLAGKRVVLWRVGGSWHAAQATSVIA